MIWSLTGLFIINLLNYNKAMKIKNNVYWIGELNPLLRKFDIVMETQWGTSYNSYLIKDELGDVIVDTVHERFCDSLDQKTYFTPL